MVEIQENNTIQLPHTLEEFIEREHEKLIDGFKYEWNNGEIVKFEGMKMRYLYIYHVLTNHFFERGYIEKGILILKPEIILNESQLRRPDIAYFTHE